MKSFQGHSVKWAEIGSSWNSSLGPSSSWMIVKLIRWCFLPKGNLRLILWSLGSLWWHQIYQNKLTSALFLRTNEKKHTVFLHLYSLLPFLIPFLFPVPFWIQFPGAWQLAGRNSEWPTLPQLGLDYCLELDLNHHFTCPGPRWPGLTVGS